MSCPFCTLPEIKERTILENDLAFAFPTNIPLTPGHLVLCPKRCVSTCKELTSNELNALFDLIPPLQDTLKKMFGAEGFNFAWNEGTVAGQEVHHFHLQIVPRKRENVPDPRISLYEPAKNRSITPQQELLQMADHIKKHIL